MKETLASHLKPLVAAYFPDQGDIQVVLALAAGDQEWFFTFRRQEDSDDPAANEDTIFEIGSITMVFTACLLADMVSKQQVRLNDPVKRFLPATARVPSYRGQEITLLDLGNHTSALPRIPSNFPETITDPADPCCNYTVQHLYAFLADFQLRRPIGWRRDYSNLGVGLLAHVLALATGRDFQELVAERIGAPLGLQDTTVKLTPAQTARFIQGHSVVGQPVPPWDMAALLGAGGLRSTARELLSFVQTQRAHEGPLQEAVKICQTPRPKSGRGGPWLLRYGVAIGLCALTLAALWYFPIMPGIGWFVPWFFAPVLFSGLFGGLGPGLLAAVMQTIGGWLLFGENLNAPLHGVVCVLIAWLASANHRKRARPEVLGWEQYQKDSSPSGPRILWQSGETGGHAGFVGFQKDGALAVVLLANCALPVAQLGVQVFNVLESAK